MNPILSRALVRDRRLLCHVCRPRARLISFSLDAMRSAIILYLGISTTFYAQMPPVGPHGEPAKELVTFAPKPAIPFEARVRHYKGTGLFMLHVRPDGTVAVVDTLESTGHTALDQASVEALSRWRFVPGAVKNVKVPINYTGNYPKS